MDAAGPVDAQTRPPCLAKRADAFRTASTGHHQETFLFREERGHFYFALTGNVTSIDRGEATQLYGGFCMSLD
jgi:hypothetical protein